MSRNNFIKLSGILLALVVAFVLTLPASAFYLQVPKSLHNLKVTKVSQGVLLVSEQFPSGEIFSNEPAPNGYSMPEQGMMGPGDQMGPGMMGPGGNQCAPGTECGPGQGGQMMGPGGPGGQQFGPSPEEMQKQFERMKKDALRMQRDINRLVTVFQNAEKKGIVVPQEIKDKMDRAKAIIEAIKTAESMEALQEAGMEEFGELIQSLEQARQEIVEAAQRMQQVKKGMKDLAKGLKMFENQIARLSKQGISAPVEITENLSKVKAIIAAVQAAQTWDAVEAAGLEDIQDLMQGLDESRQQLEMLSRWPQTLKQVNQELKRLDAALKRDKLIVSRLAKKGIDLSATLSEFEAAIGKLRGVRDEAVSKMKSGDSEGAFELLENDFFQQLEDVWQYDKTIQTMSNLGRFNSDFKRAMAEAKMIIKNLKRKKIDTSELEVLVAQAEAKGKEVLVLMKQKPIDEDAIMIAIQEMEDIRQEFESKVDELTGKEEEELPWEKGPILFKEELSVPSALGKIMPKKPQAMPPLEGGAGPGPMEPMMAP